MTSRRTLRRLLAGLSLSPALLAAPALAQSPSGGLGGTAGPIQVGVLTLTHQAVPVTAELPGRVTASQTADVRPQVGGIVKSVNFRPGQQVKQNDVLYEIDSASYDAAVAVQKAALQKAEAAQASAQSKVDRYTQLASTNNLSASDLQDAEATLAQAKADVASAQASLQSASISVGLTRVTAPISGLISDTSVTQGGLVTAAQATALATIRQLDPSYVDLVETSANLLKVRAQVESGNLKRANGGGPQTTAVHLKLEDGSSYNQAGTLTLADVVVSESTGTFTIRASFPNPDRVLLPGMFVRATVELGTEPNGYLVPQRAVTFDASGQATALFIENNKAASHVLTTTGASGNDWIVTAGISDGAQLIVDGLQKVSNGSAVTPVAVTLDANGVAVDTGSASSAAPSAEASSSAAAPAPTASANASNPTAGASASTAAEQ